MSKQVNIERTGEVVQELGNSMFRVSLDMESNVEHKVLCTISGKIRKNFIKIIVGDRVKVELSPYDLTKGRIVTRLPLKSNSESKS